MIEFCIIWDSINAEYEELSVQIERSGRILQTVRKTEVANDFEVSCLRFRKFQSIARLY